MMKKVVIVGLIFAGFLFASTFSVTAANQLSYEDATGDVCKTVDQNCVEHVGMPNIDIYKLSSTKSGAEVQLSLQLFTGGKIQNSEDYNYLILLGTDSNNYSVWYSSEGLFVYDDEYNDIAVNTYSGVGTTTLTASFDLYNAGEELLDLSAATDYISPTSGDEYSDTYPSVEILVDVGGPYSGYEDEPIHFSGSVEGSDSGYVWEWDFGDGNNATGQDQTYTYDEPGTYDVLLYVHSADETKIGYDNTTVTIKPKGSTGAGDKDSKGSGLLLFVVLIVVIVVAGVAVVVYVMRR